MLLGLEVRCTRTRNPFRSLPKLLGSANGRVSSCDCSPKLHTECRWLCSGLRACLGSGGLDGGAVPPGRAPDGACPQLRRLQISMLTVMEESGYGMPGQEHIVERHSQLEKRVLRALRDAMQHTTSLRCLLSPAPLSMETLPPLNSPLPMVS